MSVTSAGILLAAGAGTRMAGPVHKLLLEYNGQPLVAHAARLVQVCCRPAIAVVSSGKVAHALATHAPQVRVSIIGPGQHAASLRAGLALLDAACGGAFVFLADMPVITEATVGALQAEAARFPDHYVVPVHAGQRGNPVYIPRRAFGDVAALTGDAGPRGLVRIDERVRRVEVDDPGVLTDVDTWQDYQALHNRS